jgi:uncharacterized membrane protein
MAVSLFINIPEFIGRLHPALVHLPIGILIIAFILQWVSRRNKTENFHKAITISLLVGMISAIASCISGFILSRNDEYDVQAVSIHQWLGISTAIASIVLYILRRWNKAVSIQWPMMILVFALVFITGHFGGDLARGSDYLLQPLRSEGDVTEAAQKPIPDVQEALVYEDVIQPLLKSKCYACHNENKKKGGLRMDEPDLLMKGGKDGIVIKAGDAANSELIKRLLLPREDEHHMPPKEKPQPAEHQITLINWWIASGASFTKKVKELEQPEKIKPVLLALQRAPEERSTPEVPEEPVVPADDAAIKKLQDRGVVILPVAQNSNYLQANFVTVADITTGDMQLLLPVKKQLVWLKTGNSGITDSALAIIAQCTKLLRLQLDHTNISDQGLAALKALKELRYLNLVGTKVTAQGVMQLSSLTKLRSLYVYQTGISGNDWQSLQKAFPKTQVDTGGYVVPTLVSDTTVLKYVPPK